MHSRSPILILFVAITGAWLALPGILALLGASTVEEDATQFFKELNGFLINLAAQPDWLRASVFGFALLFFATWALWPGLRRWVHPPDFEDVRTWSVSLRLGSLNIFGGEDRSPTFRGARFVNHSRTQKRVLDVFIEAPTDDPDTPHWSASTQAEVSAERRALWNRDMGHRRFMHGPIALEPGEMLEGELGLGEIRPVVNPSLFTKIRFRDAVITVREHRSGITMKLKPFEHFDALSQKKLRY